LAIVVCRAVVLAVRYVYIKNERLRAAVSAAMVASLCILWLPETGKVISAWGDEERLFLITHANYPRNIEALVNLSSVYLNRHKFERAKVFVEKARQIAPENLGAIMNAFALFSGSGQLTAALELMDRHPQLGGRAEVWVRRGEIMERLERFDEAVAAFQRAFDITFGTAQSETRYIAGYRLVVALLRTGERRQAEDLVDRLLLEYPHRKELLTVRRLLSNGDISGGPLRTQ
jgi:tetratricopeptide (TPR) repeat protein